MKYYVELRDDLGHLPCGKLHPVVNGGVACTRERWEPLLDVRNIQDATGYVVKL